MAGIEGFSQGTKVGAVPAQTPTISTSPAYTSGDQVGATMTFAAGRSNGRGGRITGVKLVDKGAQSAALELHLWIGSAAPTVTSSDNGAANITDANWNMDNYLGCVVLSSYQTFSGNSVSSAACAIDFVCNSANTSIFGLLVTRGTPTYASTTDIIVGLNVIQD